MNKRVLAFVPSVKEGDGITKVYMSYYQELVNNGYIIDFMILDKDTNAYYSDVICGNGGKIYSVPSGKYKYDKVRINYISQVFDNNKYVIVHNNIPGPNGRILLGIAKKKQVPVRIYHVHNPRNNLSIKSKLSGAVYYKKCIKNANYLMACSNSAGISVFKNKTFQVLHNAINPSNYAFNETHRNELKSQYNIKDKTVIGTACRMEYQKNPFFLIDCFTEYHKRNNNSVLLWMGDGTLKNKIIAYCKEKEIIEDVIFAGIQKDVGKWYSAMDFFVLPSKFEGLGMVFLEAQANGLTCLGSCEVPADTEITQLMHRMPVSEGAYKWSVAIERLLNDSYNRGNYITSFKDAGYDLDFEKDKLAEIYNILTD